MEECVLSTEQIRYSAALLDAVIELLIEVCALAFNVAHNGVFSRISSRNYTTMSTPW